jgi:hemerythrin superfamily protein
MPSLTIDELSKALKRLTYGHIIFSKRAKELKNLLDENPPLKEFFSFIDEALLPHGETEEELIFPLILKLKPDKKELVEKLIEAHKYFLEECKKLKGSIAEIVNKSKELLESIERHAIDEEPLYQLILGEVEKIGKS